MPSKRTGYAPWSLTREAGVLSATVDGTIEVPQNVQPTISTGFCDEKGNWVGVKSDDNQFVGFTKMVAIANGASTLAPDTNNHPSINMKGFTGLQFAFKTTSAGNYSFQAVMGPNTVKFANITVASTEGILIVDSVGNALESAFAISNKNIGTANAYFVFTVLADRLKSQENMQVLITNSSGSEATMEFAFRRLV